MFTRDDGKRIPSATCRLQMGPGFTFRQLEAVVPYLDALGITDCYLSPILMAGSKSGHGYDIVDHSRLNPTLGTAADFDSLCAALRERGMGILLDTVPNHMGIAEPANRWWMDVLENGPSSSFSSHFDIDWKPVRAELQNKVLLPILEEQYGEVLESGRLRLTHEEGAFFITYYDHRLPVAPRSYSMILRRTVAPMTERFGEEDPSVQELYSILTAIGYLPSREDLPPDKVAERNREKEVIKRRLAALEAGCPALREMLEKIVESYNGVPGRPRTFDPLDDLLARQVYRPAFWKVAAEEINYRRFFDINDLAAVRVELPEVFRSSHELTFRFLAEGKVTGLRIDHPDGLMNPRAYFEQLRQTYAAALEAAGIPDRPLFVVAEKILSNGEALRDDWAVDGTTGYDYLSVVNGLFVDRDHERAFDRIYSDFIGRDTTWETLIAESKKLIMLVSMSAEINSLAHQLATLAGRNRRYRDFTLNSLTFVLREVIAALGAYRTYIEPPAPPSPGDVAVVESAVARARWRNVRTAREIFHFVQETLLLRNLREFRKSDRPDVMKFVMRFQQVTGPIMAKGVEDTAFYIYVRLVSLNEVGGRPERFGASLEEFHRQNLDRRARWPHSLLATATHDTKRGEDVRARLNVLSEMPAEWRAALARWRRLNRARKTRVDGRASPDRNDEYLYYQTLVGSWAASDLASGELELLRDRVAGYMYKAVKEAKVHTSWVNPNEAYDGAVRRFVLETLSEDPKNRFLQDMAAFQARVAYFGRFNSLSQMLLKLTSPGVPDLYQGSELWDLSLVDPDNRRPVDFERREALLREIREATERAAPESGAPKSAAPDVSSFVSGLLDSAADARIKLFVIQRALRFRREHAELFRTGDYLSLPADGAKRKHVCAYARTLERERILVIAPRLVVGLVRGERRPPIGIAVWEDTELLVSFEDRPATYRNLFTGEDVVVTPGERGCRLLVGEALARFPVALLVPLETGSSV